MGIESDMLRMLEPAVRPGLGPTGSGTSTRGANKAVPFESQPFDALLSQAQQVSNEQAQFTSVADAGKSDNDKAQQSADPLALLHHVDNASLRDLIATNAPQTDSTNNQRTETERDPTPRSADSRNAA